MDELEVGVTELEDIDLEEVGEIDEHVRLRFFLSTCDVEAHCDDVETFPAFRELVFDGEGVEPCCGEANLFGEPQGVGDALYLSLG